MKKVTVLLLLLLLCSLQPTVAKTRTDSIVDFMDAMRLYPQGFSDNKGENITISATSNALKIATNLGLEINNTLDLLYFYQISQNNDSGFGNRPELNSTWDATICAVSGLKLLNLNQTALHNWEIAKYLNDSATDMFYKNATASTAIKELTPELMEAWGDFMSTQFQLGVLPTVPKDQLTTKLQEFQYANGSYINFETSVYVNWLLALIGEPPLNIDLASKYIRSYQGTNGIFSFQQNGVTSLSATYLAIRTLSQMGRLYELSYKTVIAKYILDLQHPSSGFGEGATPTMAATWKAIEILRMLNSLGELDAPEVLQTQGFLLISYSTVALGLIGIVIINKTIKKATD